MLGDNLDKKQRDKSSAFRIIILVLLSLIVLQLYLIGIDYLFSEEPEFIPSDQFYEIDSYYSNHLNHVWTRRDIYSFYGSEGGLNLDTLGGNIFVLGKFEGNSIYDLKLMNLDSSSGDTLWKIPKHTSSFFGKSSPTGLATNTENIFLAWPGTQKISGDTQFGAAKVVSYDLFGDQVWSQSIGGARRITKMIVNQDTISIDGSFSSNYYLLESSTGKVTNSTPKENDRYIWFIDEETAYEYGDIYDSLKAVNMTSGVTTWEYLIDNQVYLAPILTNGVIVIRTRENHYVGHVLAIDKATGDLIWEMPDALSNVVVTDSIVHYLTNDLLLRSVDINSGEIIGETDFTPSKAMDPINNVYQIATDEDMIFIYFGGAHQLSAFSFDYGQP